MLIYSSTKRQFDRDVINGSIAKRIEQSFYLHGLPHQNDSEVMAWNNSLREMQKVLDSVNMIFVEKYFIEKGYPGKSVVGEESSLVAWNVLQQK